MGVVYKRRVRYCTTCDRRLDMTAARQTCESAGHVVETREQRVWWIRYLLNGRPRCESSHSEDRQVAADLLRVREGDTRVASVPTSSVASDTPVAAAVLFDDAADELILDYTMNKKRSIVTLKARINLHLRPVFGGKALSAITTASVRAYSGARLTEGATNATVNRELITH